MSRMGPIHNGQQAQVHFDGQGSISAADPNPPVPANVFRSRHASHLPNSALRVILSATASLLLRRRPSPFDNVCLNWYFNIFPVALRGSAFTISSRLGSL